MQIYNTLSRQKEEFTPLNPPHVNMYVCGVTVYDYCHIGHARAYIVFDMIRRYLNYKGYQVNYIQNFTDIDDKIIKRAQETNSNYKAVSEKFIQEYFTDFDKLGILHANNYPKATEHIEEIIALVKTLIDKEFAYVVGGDVYFEVTKFPDYGKLSGRTADDNEAGARVAVSDEKRNPLDFVLWKASKPGEPSWKSPWGPGRPGWHIECSAMSMKHLGNSFDIHGGGRDLIFPHHENEIAQSECASGVNYVKYWLHNGFVNIDNEKMSKSLGNFFTIREVLKKYEPEVIRFFMLSTHYRSPINYSDQQLEESKKAIHKLRQAIYENIDKSDINKLDFSKFKEEFIKYMDDDFNSAGAIGVLFSLATETNKQQSAAGAKLLKELAGILGLLQQNETKAEIPEKVLTLAEARKTAKANKDYAQADKLRDEILALGYQIKDTPQGTVLAKN